MIGDPAAHPVRPVVLQAAVEGVALWSDELPDWPTAAAVFRGERPSSPVASRPSPQLLPPAERRRAPDSVALGLTVAAEAVAASGRPAGTLGSVFASAHGDLAIADYLCQTLAEDPLLVSPVRFHHSVHNAVSGYWSIATGCTAPSTSLAALDHTFAAGLLEALCRLHADNTPMLLVGCDLQTVGPLSRLARSTGRLAVGLVLAPADRSSAALRLTVTYRSRGSAADAARPLRSVAARALCDNALADALPLMEWLADRQAGRDGAYSPLWLPLGGATGLSVEATKA